MSKSDVEVIASEIATNMDFVSLVANYQDFTNAIKLTEKYTRTLQRFWRRCLRKQYCLLKTPTKPFSKRSKIFRLHMGYPVLISIQTKFYEDEWDEWRHYSREDRSSRILYFMIIVYDTFVYHKLFQDDIQRLLWDIPSDQIRLLNCLTDDFLDVTKPYRGYNNIDLREWRSDYLDLPNTLTDPHTKMTEEAAAYVIQGWWLNWTKCDNLMYRFSGWIRNNNHDIRHHGLKVESIIPFHFNPVINTNIFSFLLPKIN